MTSNYEPAITDEMRARYLSRREADVVQLEAALANGDFQMMKAIAHNIKGNASTFSYDDLEALAVQLEAHAAHEVRTAAADTIAEMKSWVANQSAHGPTSAGP